MSPGSLLKAASFTHRKVKCSSRGTWEWVIDRGPANGLYLIIASDAREVLLLAPRGELVHYAAEYVRQKFTVASSGSD